MRPCVVLAITLLMVPGSSASAQGEERTEGGRVLGFEPTMGVEVEVISTETVRQGAIPTFSPSGVLGLTSGSPFDNHTWSDSWTTVTRGDISVRYHNDDDMRHFGGSFYLNDREISPGYPVTAAAIDAEGRVWVSLHAVSAAANRWRVAWKVYSSEGLELFALEAPSGETVFDAHGDLVLFVREIQSTTVEIVARRLSPDREDANVLWW